MIKKTVFFLIFMAVFFELSAQNLPGETYEQPVITQLPMNMTFDEFSKLRRTLNWQRIFAASVIPGYIHFYADHKQAGYAIAGVRMVGAALMGYAIADEINRSDNTNVLFSLTDSLNAYTARTERNLALFAVGMALNVIGYAFDWAHGDLVIERERNTVLYKYGLQKNWQPAVGLWLDSRRRLLGATFQIRFRG